MSREASSGDRGTSGLAAQPDSTELAGQVAEGAIGAASGAAGIAAAAGAPEAQHAQEALTATGEAVSSAQELQHDPVGGLLGLVGGVAGLAGAAAAASGASEHVGQAASVVSSATGVARSLAGLTAPIPSSAPSSAPASTSPAVAPSTAAAASADAPRSQQPAAARSEQGSWTFTSEDRHVRYRLESDADGASEWTIRTFHLSERLDQPFECVVDVSCDDTGAEPLAFLGRTVKIEIVRGNLLRNVAGIVRRVVRGASGGSDRHLVATLTVVPALWALSRNRDSRIFQDKKVAEILREVIDARFSAFDREVRFQIEGEFHPREYCVQWEESDFDFVSRLMEEEGIYYFFDFSGDKEVLVVTNVPTAFTPFEGEDGDGVPFSPLTQAGGPIEAVLELTAARQLTANKAVVREYDWTRPDTEFKGETCLVPPDDHPETAELEEYFHGPVVTFDRYGEPSFGGDDASPQSAFAVSRRQIELEIAHGRTEVIGLSPGVRFTLRDHPVDALNIEWLVVAVTHEGSNAGEASGSEHEEYLNHVEIIPAEHTYRPRRTRFKPRVSSVMTATVVGPASEEIWTDVHGRVKVQFHWDRLGQRNEKSSCFLRSMQPWAGQGWGFVFLPRIGMEVVVSFVDGDIDRPLVIGTVYKGADFVPPLDLPSERTKSIIKTSSTPGNGGYNELSFEDADGSEMVHIRAQKDMSEQILNDHTESTGNDQSTTVGHDQTLTVENDRTIRVNHDEDHEVAETRSVTTKHHTELVHETQTLTVGKTRDVEIGEKDTETFYGGREVTVEQFDNTTVTANKNTRVSGQYNIVADEHFRASQGGETIYLKDEVFIESSTKSQVKSPGARLVLDGNEAKVLAAGLITLESGGCKIEIGNGKVAITAPTLEVLAGGSELKLDSSGAVLAGTTMTRVSAAALVTIMGGIVSVN